MSRPPLRTSFADAFDLLIVGGGIVGAGVARDAAMRGLRTALVEQADFASGTSSRSTRLLHGGLRYLAQGRLGLVYEAGHEKHVIHRIAPHLAAPLQFVFPTYRRSGWPRWKLRVGVKLYDGLAGTNDDAGYGKSDVLDVAETLQFLPAINSERLTGAVRYFDAMTNDARLVIDTLRSAAAHGAIVRNYARFENADRDQSTWRCRVHDVEGGETRDVTARCVVNAAGPWADRLPHSQVKLRLTKGVHLVIDQHRLPIPAAVVMTDGRRILFAIPWGQRVYLGTTDTDFDGPPQSVRTGPADVEYILGVVNRTFPDERLSPQDVLSDWAGLRPLLASRRGKPSDISRSHQIRRPEPGWIDVAGGKLTTYRLIAEQTVDLVLRELDGGKIPCRTADEPLLAGDGVHAYSGILPPPVSREAVLHYCREEWVEHLDDVMTRRAGWTQYHGRNNAIAPQVAEWMAEMLGWGDARTQDELLRFERAT